MKIKHVYGNVLKLDIPLTIKIRTIEGGVPTEREEPFYPDISKGCTVILGSGLQYNATVSGNVAHIEDDGIIDIGTYKVTVKCYDEEGNPYRYMVRDIIEICEATIEAGIEAGVEFNAETYTLEGAVFIAYGEQVQADWEEDDETSKAFIKNKPEIPVVPTNVSAFNNDVGYLTQHQDISGKEDNSNKVTSWQVTPDDTHYPSEKLVKDSIDGVDKVFVAEYGVTTYQQIIDAYNAGKAVFCFVPEAPGIMTLNYVTSSKVGFFKVYSPYYYFAECQYFNNIWNLTTTNLEVPTNKKTTIAGNEASGVYYPTTKAVADYVEEAKKQMLRELYISTDRRPDSNVNRLRYNDTGADIIRTAEWGERVVHKAGCYWMNGLGDITEEEMLKMYTLGVINPNPFAAWSGVVKHFDSTVPFRTFFNISQLNWNGVINYYSCGMNEHNIVVFHAGNNNPQWISGFRMWNTGKRAVVPTLEVSNITNTYTSYNSYYAAGLQNTFLYIMMKSLKISCPIFRGTPLIMYKCIKYLVDNAANDSAITITVHPTTYSYLTDETAMPAEHSGVVETPADIATVTDAELVGMKYWDETTKKYVYATKQEWQQIVTDATAKNISFASN